MSNIKNIYGNAESYKSQTLSHIKNIELEVILKIHLLIQMYKKYISISYKIQK